MQRDYFHSDDEKNTFFDIMTSLQPEAKKWQSIVTDFLEDEPVSPILVVIGPTAAGKTAFSIELAAHLDAMHIPAAIVNADSRQLYTLLDIGTAKITEEEKRGVAHHLFSVLDPKEPVTVAWYQREAIKTIDELHQQNILPIIVGGSMLYVSSIVDGLVPIESDPKKRLKLEKEYDKDQGKTLYARLTSLDPQTAATIPIENKVYVVRAMEMIEGTGKTKSELLETAESPYTSLILGIDQDDEVLRERIEKRVQDMFGAGWVEEVRSLKKNGYTKDDPGMQSVGYREILAALETGIDPTNSCIEEIVRKTWQYARRHRTWWREDPRVRWIVL